MWSHEWFDTYYYRYPCQKGQTIPPYLSKCGRASKFTLKLCNKKAYLILSAAKNPKHEDSLWGSRNSDTWCPFPGWWKVLCSQMLTVAHMCLMQRKIGGKNCFQFQHSSTCWYKIQLRKLDSRDWYWKLLACHWILMAHHDTSPGLGPWQAVWIFGPVSRQKALNSRS